MCQETTLRTICGRRSSSVTSPPPPIPLFGPQVFAAGGLSRPVACVGRVCRRRRAGAGPAPQSRGQLWRARHAAPWAPRTRNMSIARVDLHVRAAPRGPLLALPSAQAVWPRPEKRLRGCKRRAAQRRNPGAQRAHDGARQAPHIARDSAAAAPRLRAQRRAPPGARRSIRAQESAEKERLGSGAARLRPAAATGSNAWGRRPHRFYARACQLPPRCQLSVPQLLPSAYLHCRSDDESTRGGLLRVGA